MKEKKTNKPEQKIDELAKAKADAENWKNQYYKAYADMENLRKSIERDHREALKYRSEGFINDLLPVLDGFHMALQNEPSSVEMKNFLIGFEYIYRNLVSVLENEGVTEFAPKENDKFDASFMHAIEAKYDEGEPNRVLKILTKGYKLHDHLIRPAVVVVSTNIKDQEESKENKSDVPMDA